MSFKLYGLVILKIDDIVNVKFCFYVPYYKTYNKSVFHLESPSNLGCSFSEFFTKRLI